MKMVDLSHMMNLHTPGWVGYAGNQMYYVQNLQSKAIVAQRIETAMHAGTHLDGAMHATDAKGDMGSYALDFLVGQGAVVDVSEHMDDWAIIIGGDSHTRMSKGVAFGADSGTVALALATGEATMPIPDSVKVTFKGTMAPHMDFRDVVHATQMQMLQQHGDNVFQGRIIEVHIGTLLADQAFPFTDWISFRHRSRESRALVADNTAESLPSATASTASCISAAKPS